MKEKKIKILEAFGEIIKSKRYHEVTISDVATRCKVGKGTIYTYFKSKEEMYFELAMHGLEVITKEINDIPVEDKAIKEVIFCVANKLSIFFEKREAVIKVLQELSYRTKIMTKERKERMFQNQTGLRSALVRILQVGVEEGIISESHSLIQLSELMIHTLIGRAHWNNDVPKIPVEDLISIVLFKK